MHKPYAIFDMDGTLVDSMQYWSRLAGEFLTRKGITEIPPELLERLKTLTITGGSALFIETFGLSGTPESVAAEMNEMMDEHYRNDIPLKPCVATYVKQLRLLGVTLCVASATAQPLIEDCLKRLGIADDFAFLLSCEEVGCGKDRPDVYLEAARRLGANAADIAVYEDALYALNTARQAGFYTVGVFDESQRADWEAVQTLADEVIADWSSAAQALN